MTWLYAFGALALALGATRAIFFFVDLVQESRFPSEVDVSDTALVRAQIAEARNDVVSTSATIATFQVTDERTHGIAAEIIRRVRARAAEVEAHKERYMKPLRELMKLVHEDAQPVIAAAAQIEATLKERMTMYTNNVAALRAQAEAEARRLQAAQAPVQEQRAALVVVANAVPPKNEGTHYRDNWQATITDQTQVEDKYWTRIIVKQLIDEEVKRQVREAKAKGVEPKPVIPGVTITNNRTPVVKG